MPTRYGEMTKELQRRWKTSWQGDAFAQLRTAFDGPLFAVAQLGEKGEGLRAEGKYSNQGLNDEIRALAARDVIPVLRSATRSVESVQSMVRSKRDALARPTPDDPDDNSAALLRMEMRAWLKSLPRAEVLALLLGENADQRLQLAALEVPPPMAGLTKETRGKVLEHLLGKRHGPQLARLNALEDAAELAAAAIGIANYELQKSVGFAENDSEAFAAWATTTAAEGDVEVAPGERQVNAQEHTSRSTTTGVDDFDHAVEAIIDEAFAKALPALYPDHPVNKKSLP